MLIFVSPLISIQNLFPVIQCGVILALPITALVHPLYWAINTVDLIQIYGPHPHGQHTFLPLSINV